MVGGVGQSASAQPLDPGQVNKTLSSISAKLKGLAGKVKSTVKFSKIMKSFGSATGKEKSLASRNTKTSSQMEAGSEMRSATKATKLKYTMLAIGLLAIGAGVIAGSGGAVLAGAGVALLATAVIIK